MISLKASRFRVSHDSDEYHVFTNTGSGYEDVTDTLSENDKDELIDDLIYCIQDIVKNDKKGGIA